MAESWKYSDKEIRMASAHHAQVDNINTEVYWQCSCGYGITSLVTDKYTHLQCPDCFRYMQWSYKPFQEVA